MNQHQDVRPHAQRRIRPGVHERRALGQRTPGPCADGAAGGETEMADDDVGAGFRHRRRIGLGEHVGRRQQAARMGCGDHIHLQPVGHAGLFEVGAQGPIDQADRGEVLHPGEADALHLIQEHAHLAERVGAVDAGEHRRARHQRQHLVRHLHDDGIGVAIGEQPGERPAPSHAVAAGVVQHDQVDAAGFLALRGQADPGAPADDRLAAPGHVLEALHQRGTFEARHVSGPPASAPACGRAARRTWCPVLRRRRDR